MYDVTTHFEVYMAKVLRNYRLSPRTLEQITDLASEIGIDATAVITRAVEDKHHQFLIQNGTRLVRRRDGRYDVVVQGKTLAVLESEQVENLPEDVRKRFMEDGILSGESLLLLDLAAGRGRSIELKPTVLKPSGSKRKTRKKPSKT
jgi:hypothetical protein